MADRVTTGVTYYEWAGRPALTLDGQVRFIPSPGEGWTSVSGGSPVSLATIRREAASIGEGAFSDRFDAPPWNAPDLDGWYQRRDPNRPYDSYAKARFWASR